MCTSIIGILTVRRASNKATDVCEYPAGLIIIAFAFFEAS